MKSLTRTCRFNVYRAKINLNYRYFSQEAWFDKEQHKRLSKHKNKWVSKSDVEFTDPLSKQIYQSNSSNQVLSILKNVEINHEWMKPDSTTNYHLYTVALRKLIDLQQFDTCWLLFDDIKKSDQMSNVLCTPIYNTMIYLCVQLRNKYSLKQALELYTQMSETYNLKPDLITYTNLISLCTSTAAWDKAENFWKILMETPDIAVDLSAYNSMIDSFVKGKQIDKAIELFKQLRNNPDLSLKPDTFTYSILISAFGRNKQIKLAEKMFLLALKDCGENCEIMVYQPLIDAYGNVGDIYNCLKLFNLLLTNQSDSDFDFEISSLCNHLFDYRENKHNDTVIFDQIKKYNSNKFPKLNVICFNAVLKGFTRMNQMQHFEKKHKSEQTTELLVHLLISTNTWLLIDYLLYVMDELKHLSKTSTTYGILFHLCNWNACFYERDDIDIGDSMKKAMEIYNMMRDDKKVLIRTDMEMCNFLRTGLSFYKDDKEKKFEFVKWWMEQLDEMKLKRSEYSVSEIVKSGVDISKLNLF